MANNPTLLTRPLAEDGQKNTIPDTTDVTSGLFSQQYGWQSINSLPLQAGGKAVKREDFNGAFNLLGGIAFMAQKGFTFNWSADQSYYVDCVVIDPTDGIAYRCKADVAAGQGAPSQNATNWEVHNLNAKLSIADVPKVAGFNAKQTFTSSGTFTPTVTGMYKVTLQGGGGGGAGAGKVSSYASGGGGGGQGGHLEFYEKLTAGNSYSFTIGAGGTGGTGAASGSTRGTAGGNSMIIIGDNTYLAKGGYLGGSLDGDYARGGEGGQALINDVVVGQGDTGLYGVRYAATYGYQLPGGTGGGACSSTRALSAGKFGGGGTGGSYNGQSTTYNNGANGGDGFITFEWQTASLV